MRRGFSDGLVLAAIVLLAGCGPEAERTRIDLPDAPGMNVIVVSFDALRASSLGVYGYERGTSPRIDAFAQGALVFDNAQNAANSTPTSFASSWTGRLPMRVFRGWQLDDAPTLARSFARDGYHTAAFLNNVQLVEERNFNQGFDEYTVYRDVARDRRVLQDAIEWLQAGPPEPFLLWVHFLSPHSPYDARPMSRQFYDDDYSGPYQTTSGRNTETDDPADIRRLRDLYDGEVYFADYLFGELWSGIRSLGFADNSLVVLTSDHGEELHEHGRFGHHRLYQQVIQVPLMLYHPGAAGARTEIPAQNIDLFPTLAGLTGVSVPRVDGRDLRRGVSPDRARVTVGMTNRRHHGMVIRQGDDKLLVSCAPEYIEEFYDLAVDPAEENNILVDRIDRVEELFPALEEMVGGTPCRVILAAVRGADETRGLDEKLIEKLKALGYLQ